jgi:hypothetical protein
MGSLIQLVLINDAAVLHISSTNSSALPMRKP